MLYKYKNTDTQIQHIWQKDQNVVYFWKEDCSRISSESRTVVQGLVLIFHLFSCDGGTTNLLFVLRLGSKSQLDILEVQEWEEYKDIMWSSPGIYAVAECLHEHKILQRIQNIRKYNNSRSWKISCDNHHGQLTPKLNSERKVEDSSTKSRLNWCCPDYKYRVTDVTLLHFCQRTKSGRSKYQVHKADTFVFNHSPGAASQIWPPFDKQQFSHESLDNSIKYPFISHVIKERMTNLVVPIKTFNYLSTKCTIFSFHIWNS